jgi:DNA polymerase III delta prime subunit
MNNSAGNSLLKTLEEPTEKTIIILVANREERVLATLRSRCQRVYFGLKNDNEIRDYLQANNRIDLPEGVLRQVIEVSHGKYKLAEELAINPKFLEEKGLNIEKFRKALKGGIAETFEFIEEETKGNKVNSEVIEDWLFFLHSFIKESIREKRSRQVIEKVFKMEKILITVKNKIDNSNANARILLENYFVQLI